MAQSKLLYTRTEDYSLWKSKSNEQNKICSPEAVFEAYIHIYIANIKYGPLITIMLLIVNYVSV